MFPNVSLIRLIGSMMAILLPVGLSAQKDRDSLPGRIPDYEWKDAPKMEYDPHPDKHFKR